MNAILDYKWLMNIFWERMIDEYQSTDKKWTLICIQH